MEFPQLRRRDPRKEDSRVERDPRTGDPVREEDLKRAQGGFSPAAARDVTPVDDGYVDRPAADGDKKISLDGAERHTWPQFKLGTPGRRPSEAAQQINARMAAKYPALAFILRDPDAFMAEMQRRFAEQKAKTPDTPYRFDFSELGMPVVNDIAQNVDQEIGALTEARAAAKPGSERERQLGVALRMLGGLKAESARYLAQGSVAYRDLVELSFFYTRVIGHFDIQDFGLRDRTMLKIFDRTFNGYAEMSIDEEYDAYQKRDFKVFQMDSKSKGFQAAQQPFTDAFFNPDHIEDLWIPTTSALGVDVLMRLMSKPIELVGVAYKPAFSDGFFRTAGDFWVHDLRHSSDKFHRRAVYLERYQLTPGQVERLDEKAEEWGDELEQAIAKVPDPGLREAIDLLSFNFHHDRGFPLLPSEYLNPKANPVGIAALLYLQLKIGGDGAHSALDRPIRNFTRANAWLKAFWQARLQTELQINPAARAALEKPN